MQRLVGNLQTLNAILNMAPQQHVFNLLGSSHAVFSSHAVLPAHVRTEGAYVCGYSVDRGWLKFLRALLILQWMEMMA